MWTYMYRTSHSTKLLHCSYGVNVNNSVRCCNIYLFLHLLHRHTAFSSTFQFPPSSKFTRRAKQGSQVSLPACAATLRASPAPSWPGWRTAWTSPPSCPNNSPCKVKSLLLSACAHILFYFAATVLTNWKTTNNLNAIIIAYQLSLILLLLIMINYSLKSVPR